jgi:hypothetical protein
MAYASEREINLELVGEYLETIHLGFKPNPGEIRGALTFVQVSTKLYTPATRNEAVSLPFRSAEQLVPVLLGRHRSLEVARKPRLITSDTPLTIWHRPSYMDKYRGRGIVDADEIRFPLSPAHQLVLTPQPRPAAERIEPKRVRQCNTDQAVGCYRFIVGHPDRQRDVREIPLAAKRPAIRFNEAPGYEEGPDGELMFMGEVLHTWVQRFASAAGSSKRRR